MNSTFIIGLLGLALLMTIILVNYSKKILKKIDLIYSPEKENLGNLEITYDSRIKSVIAIVKTSNNQIITTRLSKDQVASIAQEVRRTFQKIEGDLPQVTVDAVKGKGPQIKQLHDKDKVVVSAKLLKKYQNLERKYNRIEKANKFLNDQVEHLKKKKNNPKN